MSQILSLSSGEKTIWVLLAYLNFSSRQMACLECSPRLLGKPSVEGMNDG